MRFALTESAFDFDTFSSADAGEGAFDEDAGVGLSDIESVVGAVFSVVDRGGAGFSVVESGGVTFSVVFGTSGLSKFLTLGKSSSRRDREERREAGGGGAFSCLRGD